MKRTKEWWDALTEDEHYVIKASEERSVFWMLADMSVTGCKVCGVEPITSEICEGCNERVKKIKNKANEAVKDIAWEFHHELLIYTIGGGSMFVKVNRPQYHRSGSLSAEEWWDARVS